MHLIDLAAVIPRVPQPLGATDLALRSAALVLGPAIIAALVTGALNKVAEDRSQRRDRLAATLALASHLEDYAFACATFTDMSYEEERDMCKRAEVPELTSWSEKVSWGSLPPVPAADAASLRINVTIAIGIVAATPWDEGINLVQARRLRSELGIRSWEIAASLRSEAGVSPIDRGQLRWDFVDYLWGQYAFAVSELKMKDKWVANEKEILPAAHLFMRSQGLEHRRKV